MLRLESQLFSHFSDACGKGRFISFDATAGNLPGVLVHGLYEKDTSETVAEQAPGTDMLCWEGLVELRGGRWVIGEWFLAHGLDYCSMR